MGATRVSVPRARLQDDAASSTSYWVTPDLQSPSRPSPLQAPVTVKHTSPDLL